MPGPGGGERAGREAQHPFQRPGEQGGPVGGRAPAHEGLGVEPVDRAEQVPRGGARVAGAEDPARHALRDDLFDQVLPRVHLPAHSSGERIVAASQRPRLHPHRGHVVARAIEQGRDERRQPCRGFGMPGQDRTDLRDLGRHHCGEGRGDQRIHRRPVVCHQGRGDAGPRGDGPQGDRGESVPDGEYTGSGGQLGAAFGRRLAGCS
ncbi:hypothetical protein O159_01890 [Leifsonia xyli subsp. cynodontis DSM 46306]|uniref:Uncharacterized protein n=1 Tax=Leifsonia xyli subsp. cynodontis DSM 46306 TaxID=1389489 RepID=U3P3X7_LEIXC|nr:hypothetical protein O159_01890 [Leifsonia xyli subsp. cynodontis DSM 46306]